MSCWEHKQRHACGGEPLTAVFCPRTDMKGKKKEQAALLAPSGLTSAFLSLLLASEQKHIIVVVGDGDNNTLNQLGFFFELPADLSFLGFHWWLKQRADALIQSMSQT